MNWKLISIFVAAALMSVPLTHGDTLHLKSGAELHGLVKVKRAENQSITEYIVKLSTGGYVKIAASRVRRWEKLSGKEKAYADLLEAMPDTARSHWQMAKFCKKQRLNEQREFHVQRTLELDPNHAEARRSEGYSWRDGQWIRQDEVMLDKGYVQYKGRWMLPQQAAASEAEEEQERHLGEARSRVKTLRKWLGSNKHDRAIEGFATLKDPIMIGPLIESYDDEESAEFRELYLRTLARFDGPSVTRKLVNVAMDSTEDPGVLSTAIELTTKLPNKAYASSLLLPYLGSSNNWAINQAAVLLGRLGDPNSVLPLIDSLVTTHTRTIQQQPGSINTQFGSDGSIGFNAGEQKKTIVENKENSHVLRALTRLTSQNFGYSEYDWREWYKKLIAPAQTNLRRDF
ncbi:MAG: HEAT repeat domain-containing protein [Planctomycetales bacterium]|nr:HEAT repeat domain-containing protein [Planctomycetales bacterium]